MGKALKPIVRRFNSIAPTAILGAVLVAIFCLVPWRVEAAGCQQLFVKQYHHAYQAVQAVVAVPLIYSTVSPSLVNEAQIRAIVRDESKQEQLRLQQTQAQQSAPQQVNQRPSILAQKCARCHSGATPKGGKVIDGKTPADNDIFIRSTEMLGANIDVPDEMKQVVASMSPAEKGQALDELIPLRRAFVAQAIKQQPEFVPPPPDGGLR